MASFGGKPLRKKACLSLPYGPSFKTCTYNYCFEDFFFRAEHRNSWSFNYKDMERRGEGRGWKVLGTIDSLADYRKSKGSTVNHRDGKASTISQPVASIIASNSQGLDLLGEGLRLAFSTSIILVGLLSFSKLCGVTNKFGQTALYHRLNGRHSSRSFHLDDLANFFQA